MTKSFIHELYPNYALSKLSQKARAGLASLDLEGFTFDDKAMNDLIAFDSGEITEQEFLCRALQRAKVSHEIIDKFIKERYA